MIIRRQFSFALKICGTLLQEGACAFILIIRGTANAEQRSFQEQSFPESHVHAFIHRFHAVLDGQRSGGNDLARNLLRENDEPVGYAALDDFGHEAYNGLTAVRRAWRRRGIATALKRTQIAAAKRAGFRRLITGSEERNDAMRSLNAKLGYTPEPRLNTLVLRGPADVRSRRGDDGRRAAD